MADISFNIDEYLAADAAARARATAGIPAPAAAVEAPLGKAYKAGRFGAKVAKFIPRIAGASELVSGVTGAAAEGPSLRNAIQTGVGASSLFSPHARAVASGMFLADLLPESFYRAIGFNIPKPVDVMGPATKEFLRKGKTAVAPPVSPEPFAGTTPPATAPVSAPALTADQLLNTPTYKLPEGTGAIQFGANPATTIETGKAKGGEYIPARQYRNEAGNFVAALLGLKQITGDNARKLAAAKAATAARAAEGTFLRGQAASDTANRSLAAALLDFAKTRDVARYSAILHGRSPTPSKTIPVGGVGLNPATDPSLVFDRNTGETRLVMPTPQVTQITLAQAVASAKKHGVYKSDEQVRAIIDKNPRYKLVD